MKPRIHAIVAVILGLVTVPVGAADLLFVTDTTTDLDIPTALESDGHTVAVVTDDHASGNAALKGDLSPYSAVFWSTSQVVHDDLVLLSGLATWVGNGGRLFVTGADGTYASYNPTTAFLELLGATDGWDGGYDLSPIADVKNPLTVGVIDIRGLTPLTPGDSDSVCGPLAPGTVGLSAPTTGSGPCAGGEAYGWTFRTYAKGEIAWIESGNFASTIPPDEPLWTDPNLALWGAYNAAVRNFAAAWQFSDGFEAGNLAAWSASVGGPDPDLRVTITQPFPLTAAGYCSPPVTILIENLGEGTLEIQTLALLGRFYFDYNLSSQLEGPMTIPPYNSDNSLSVYFCPNVVTGGPYLGQLTIVSNDPGNPEIVPLMGTEVTPPEIVTMPYGNGDIWTFPVTAVGVCSSSETLTIANSGLSDLLIESVSSSDSEFNILNPPAPNTAFAPGQSYDLHVEFCPDTFGFRSGFLAIDHNAINEVAPIVIDFGGTGI